MVSEPMLGQIRLQWWRENIAAAFEGGAVRRHAVVEALTAAIRAYGLTRAHFNRLVDAREEDLVEEPLASLDALEDYAEASSARLVYLALESLDVRDRAAEQAGFHIGIAYSLAGLLRAIPFRARIGPALVPAVIAERSLARLKRAGYDPFDPALTAPDTMQSWRLAIASLRKRY